MAVSDGEGRAPRDAVAAAAAGAAGGLAGTVSMTILLLIAQNIGLLGRLPPERITTTALDAAGMDHIGRRTRLGLTGVLHVGFGCGLGAGFGLLRRQLRAPLPPASLGMAYGALAWLTNYKGWLPALGLMPAPERDRPDRPVVMILAHLVYGGTLGWVTAWRSAPWSRPA